MDEAPDNRLHAQQTDDIEQLSALRATVDAGIMRVIRDADESGVWRVDGSPSLVEWVTWRCRLTRAEAQKHVEVAAALASLPAIAAGLDDGSLSCSQVAVLVDFVESDGDAEWAEKARGMHVEQLRAWRRAARRVTAEEANLDHERRSLTWWWEKDRRFLRIKGQLPAEQGAVVDRALSRLVEQMPKLPNGTYERTDARGADALVELSGTHISADADPDRATIVIHVEAAALLGDDGAAALEGGCELAPETVRRLACEASLQTVVNHNGKSIGVGRKTRTPPPWLRRLVVKRDGCCRFPWCERKRHIRTHQHSTLDPPQGAHRAGQPSDAVYTSPPLGARGWLGHPRETRWGHRVHQARRTRLRPPAAATSRRDQGAHPGAEQDWGPERDGPVLEGSQRSGGSELADGRL